VLAPPPGPFSSPQGLPPTLRLFGRARTAGISLVRGTQELADLKSAADGLRDQVLGNVSALVAHRQNVPESAELIAGVAGTRRRRTTSRSCCRSKPACSMKQSAAAGFPASASEGACASRAGCSRTGSAMGDAASGGNHAAGSEARGDARRPRTRLVLKRGRQPVDQMRDVYSARAPFRVCADRDHLRCGRCRLGQAGALGLRWYPTRSGCSWRVSPSDAGHLSDRAARRSVRLRRLDRDRDRDLHECDRRKVTLPVLRARSTLHSGLSGNPDMDDAVRINVNRKLFAGAAVLLGVIGVGAFARSVSAGSVGVAIIIALVFGVPGAIYIRGLVRPGAAIEISSDGLGGYRVPRVISWTSVSDIRVSQQQGLFGVSHDLKITVQRVDQPPVADTGGLIASRVPTESVELSLDQLALPWHEIVTMVEKALGRNVATKRESFVSSIRAK
jgi:hypothetical protein